VRLVRLPLFDVGVAVTLIDDLLARTQRHAADFLNNLDRQPVCATATLGELRHRLGVALNDEGMSPTEVVDDLVAATADGHLGSAGGRFFAWVIGGAVPSALAADWLVSTWDNNAALYACGPASAVVEEVAGDWVKDILNLPAANHRRRHRPDDRGCGQRTGDELRVTSPACDAAGASSLRGTAALSEMSRDRHRLSQLCVF
jgi:hypothetical protein